MKKYIPGRKSYILWHMCNGLVVCASATELLACVSPPHKRTHTHTHSMRLLDSMCVTCERMHEFIGLVASVSCMKFQIGRLWNKPLDFLSHLIEIMPNALLHFL